MLNQICVKTAEIIQSVLSSQTEVKEGAVCNPTAYFTTIYNLQSGVLGIVAAHELTPNCLFTKAVKARSLEERKALNSFQDWFLEQSAKNVNLSDLYELMLLLEFPIRDGQITSDTENLNSIGSFYTPIDLADKIVALTLDDYILRNTGLKTFSSAQNTSNQVQQVLELFLSSTFADYSCGTGSFLLGILRYCKSHLNMSSQGLKSIALNFYAIEADSLSLEIAKLQVLEAIDDLSLYSELNKKFVQGNPLIAPNDEYPKYDFCHEFYYHKHLSLQPNQIPKCDIVIGNPPWGTVGFDLQHYFYLLCPYLNEIEDELELEVAIDKLSETHPKLYEWLLHHDEAIDVACEEIYNDERFEHSTMGGLHTNVLFTELCDSLCLERGTIGLVLKGSTLGNSINKRLKTHLESNNRIVARYDFSNQNQLFNIDKEEHFSIVILGDNSENEHVHKKELTRLEQIS